MPDLTLPFSVCLFGSPSLWVHGMPVRSLRTRKGYALLAFLILRAGRAVDRETLAGALWPESAPVQALSSLRRTLTDLRDALGDAGRCIIAPTMRTLGVLLPADAVDVLRFDALLARAGPHGTLRQQALELYRGPLLEGYTEDWLYDERERRAEAIATALEWLAADARCQGDLVRSIAYLRHARTLDPGNESVCRALMQAHYDRGNPGASLDTFYHFHTHLLRTLATEPSPETVALFHRLQQGTHQF